MKHNFTIERLISALGYTLAALGFSFGFVVLVLNWVSGCGQAFYYPDGTWRTGECFVISHEPKTGVWRPDHLPEKVTY